MNPLADLWHFDAARDDEAFGFGLYEEERPRFRLSPGLTNREPVATPPATRTDKPDRELSSSRSGPVPTFTNESHASSPTRGS